MATLKEIAQLCNVSPSTVSNILNGKTNVSDQTRQKVMNTITKLEYQPNFFCTEYAEAKQPYYCYYYRRSQCI